MPEQLCALRALTLCDGQVLEEDEGARTSCPCADETRAWHAEDRSAERTAARRRLDALRRL